ncbi:hypothetical protein F5884DRAFT_99781 [Xylogone sp. PMI_703]|nr:hypothetical protein F5884DRAFT_99781 [Xylogone sp. PMI_703]
MKFADIPLADESKSFSAGDPTPDSTTIAGSELEDHDDSTADSVPWPGGTYLIIEKERNRVLTLIDGKLQLKNQSNPRKGNPYWHCVETEGFLGFRNDASGMFLGHDGKKNFRVMKPHHKSWEYFCVRRHPKGGYLLMLLHYQTLLKVGYNEGEQCLVAADKDDGIRWEFVKA